MNTKVIIIIPVYNDIIRLEKCLDALSKQTIGIDNFSVRVVDNNSSVKISDVVEKYSFADYFFEEKAGSYAARNKALVEIDSDYIAFTDSDCIPSPTWLENGLQRLENSSQIMAIGGKVELFSENELPNLYEYYDLVTGFDQKSYIEDNGFSVTANLIVKSKAINLFGVFNADLMSSGDKDWCQRLTSQGYQLEYCDNALVQHPARHTISSIKTKLRRLYGGFYHNHVNVKPNRLFSFKGMLEALMPPITQMKKFKNAPCQLSFLTKCKLTLFFYYLKLYTFGYRLGLLLKLVKTSERL